MFSVIMPVWNRAGVVARAVESILAQTYGDFEVIVVDDGSSDGSGTVVAPYVSERLRLERRPHLGVSSARNHALSLATRPYVAYLDSDNVWHPEFLATMHRHLEVSSSEAAVYCLARRMSSFDPSDAPGPQPVIGGPFSFATLLRENYIDLNTFVHSRSLLSQVGAFDEDLERLVDWDLFLRMTAVVEPVFLDEILVDYLWGETDNAISRTVPLEPALKRIRSKYAGWEGPFRHVHDTVPNEWTGLSESKHRNYWLHLNRRYVDLDDGSGVGLPFMIQVEPTNACNLACPLCPVGRNELGRPTMHMPLATFRGIVDDLAGALMFLVLWDWGEPFMNPELPDMVAYATARDIRTVTSTNAHFLEDEDYVRRIFDAGLTTLIVAVDSLHDESYRVYRRRGSLLRALRGLEAAVRIKRETRSRTIINLRTVAMRQNETDLPELRKLAWTLGVDWFTVKSLNPACGSISLDDTLVPLDRRLQRYRYEPSGARMRRTAVCERPSVMANVFSNGDVVPCCYDYDSSMAVGNVNERSFTEIWKSEGFRQLRRRIRSEAATLPRCRDCGIHFELSRSGWFPEHLDLRPGSPDRSWWGRGRHLLRDLLSRWRR